MVPVRFQAACKISLNMAGKHSISWKTISDNSIQDKVGDGGAKPK